MNALPDTITEDGEVVTSLVTIDTRLVSELARAEIDQQIATAHRYPRSVAVALKNIKSLATLDEEAAQECIYALPRGGKPIRGPSIRLAEIVANQWGNCRIAARVVDVNREEKYVEAEGVFHDLEKNVASRATVRRRIVDRNGRLYNDDMIIVTGNAACSIARRNAILAGVPKSVWRSAYDSAEQVIKGDVKTLSERRGRAVSAFATWGVKAEQVYSAIGVAGEEEITLDHLPTLFGMFQAIKNGEETVESLFNSRAGIAGRDFAKVENPLADAPAKQPAKQPEKASEPPPADDGVIEGETASDDAPEPADDPDDEGGASSDDALVKALNAARTKGEMAGAQGRPKKAPNEYGPAEADAWIEGWEAGRVPDEGAGQ